MSLHEFPDLEQGSEAWHAQRRGMVTASVVGQLITSGPPAASVVTCPTCDADNRQPCVSVARKDRPIIKTFHDSRISKASELSPVHSVAKNDTSRALTALLVAERITGNTDPTYISNDMWRGIEDEPRARDLYSETYAPVVESGFMVRDDWGFEIGYSPDGLVGTDGLIEVKSRRQKKHLTTILSGQVPAENMAQIQCGLLVTGREWCDYLSYCGGMPMWRKRVTPDERWHQAIIAAVQQFETDAAVMVGAYREAIKGLAPTERVDPYEVEMV